ncbi:gamma-butyrobetaine hydroxylase-like domain-containing protein, partial [Neisseria meningitidis]
MNNIPVEIRLLKNRTVLVLTYGDEPKNLPAEFLRVYSPSAEVRGHGVGQDVLQTGKA